MNESILGSRTGLNRKANCISCYSSPKNNKSNPQISKITVYKQTFTTQTSSKPITSPTRDVETFNSKLNDSHFSPPKVTRNIEKYLNKTHMRVSSMDNTISYLTRASSKTTNVSTPKENSVFDMRGKNKLN